MRYGGGNQSPRSRSGSPSRREGGSDRRPLRRPLARQRPPEDDPDEAEDITDLREEEDWEAADDSWDEPSRNERLRGGGRDDGYSKRKIGKLRMTPRRGRRRSGGESNTSFILALLGWFLCAILSIIAFSMAMSELSTARSRREEPPGMTVAAAWISGVHLVFLALVILFVVFVRLR